MRISPHLPTNLRILHKTRYPGDDSPSILTEAADLLDLLDTGRVTYQWQWDPWPCENDWSDIGYPHDSLESALARHPQRPGPHRYCDDTIPVRLVKRTTINEAVPHE